MSALLVSFYFSFVLCLINSIAPQTTTNLCGNKLFNRFVGACMMYLPAGWGSLWSLLLIQCFLLFCQLKAYPDLYGGYVPMAYSDYLKMMSKYDDIFYVIYDDMALLKSSYFLIAFCMAVLGVVNGVIMSRCRLLQIGYEDFFFFLSLLYLSSDLLAMHIYLSFASWIFSMWCLFPWFASEEYFGSLETILKSH